MVTHSFGLSGVAFKWQMHGYGQVALVAGYHCTVVVYQLFQYALGDSDALIVQDDYADVFNRNGGNGTLLETFGQSVVVFHFGQLDNQLFVLHRQICRI